MPIADRAAALKKLTEFLQLLDQDRADCAADRDRTTLDNIYRYIDAVRSIALAVDIVQFQRIEPDEYDRWHTARIAVLRIIGQLEHADDMDKILAEGPRSRSAAIDTSADDEPF